MTVVYYQRFCLTVEASYGQLPQMLMYRYPDTQQTSPESSHTFVLKRKERTPEKGSKAIYKMALMAAIDKKVAKCSTKNKLFSFLSMGTEETSLVSFDQTALDTNDFDPEDSVVQEDQRFPSPLEESEGEDGTTVTNSSGYVPLSSKIKTASSTKHFKRILRIFNGLD